jgi:hypothetical protein
VPLLLPLFPQLLSPLLVLLAAAGCWLLAAVARAVTVYC